MTREDIVNAMSLEDAIQVFRDTNCYGTMDLAKTVILNALEQEPCEDMERKIEKEYLFESLCEDLKKLQAENKNLRNALEQEPKQGHWIIAKGGSYLGMRNACCSNCKDFYTNDWNVMNYCPNCGARMSEVSE